jgi:hypothetical protein
LEVFNSNLCKLVWRNHSQAVFLSILVVIKTCLLTTPLNSFTDGLILSVTGMNSVGEIITDGTRPSV